MKNHLYCSSPQTPPPVFLTWTDPVMCTSPAAPTAVFLLISQIDSSRSHLLPLLSVKSRETGVGGGRVTLSLLMDTAVGLRSKPARVPPWEVAEGEEPGALVGHPRRGRSGLVCVKPLHRVGKYNNMFGFFLFFFLKTRVYNPFLLTLYNLLICYSKPFFFFPFWGWRFSMNK